MRGKRKKKSSYMYSEIVIYNVHYESMIMAMSSLTFSLLILKLREAQATINWYYQQDGVPIQYKGSGSISIISDEGKRLSHIIVSVKTLYQHACLCKLNGLVYELYAKAWLILIAIGTMHHHSTIPFNPSLSLSHDWFNWKGTSFCYRNYEVGTVTDRVQLQFPWWK